MRILDWLFPAPNRQIIDLRSVGPFETTTASGPAVAEIVTEDAAAEEELSMEAIKAVASGENGNGHVATNSAMLCPKCAQMTYIQDGKCRRCTNPACLYKDGGCGE